MCAEDSENMILKCVKGSEDLIFEDIIIVRVQGPEGNIIVRAGSLLDKIISRPGSS